MSVPRAIVEVSPWGEILAHGTGRHIGDRLVVCGPCSDLALSPAGWHQEGFDGSVYHLPSSISLSLPNLRGATAVDPGDCIAVQGANCGSIAVFTRDLLSETNIKRRGLFDHSYVDKMLDLHDSSAGNFGHHIWILLVFELWCRAFIDRV